MAEQKDDSNAWGKYLGFGLEILVGVVLGYYVGMWIDGKLGSAPYGMMVGSLLGLAAGMYQLIREGLRANKD